jgi:hypothetical protein
MKKASIGTPFSSAGIPLYWSVEERNEQQQQHADDGHDCDYGGDDAEIFPFQKHIRNGTP